MVIELFIHSLHPYKPPCIHTQYHTWPLTLPSPRPHSLRAWAKRSGQVRLLFWPRTRQVAATMCQSKLKSITRCTGKSKRNNTLLPRP